MQLQFELLPDDYAIVRRAAEATVPAWACGQHFHAITRSVGELSIVCVAHAVPASEHASTGWRVLRLVGPFDLDLTGVLLAVLAPLAQAEVPVFAISTSDTDYVLIPAVALQNARAALCAAGHRDVTTR